ncbi:NAD(P)-dependent glycerol-3-phosphate dehydrogenase [Candidatus Sumerlaeota bacterium]|nr:NAD(P)-dependent glycerol-3-phosphate dehydrogenase [Candidatus Sumerlaeota bacterium]
MEQIAVLGAGAWGCTLADLLVRHGHSVRLWDYAPEVIGSLREKRVPRNLPWLRLPEAIILSAELAEAADGVTLAVFVVPSVGMRSASETLKRVSPDDGKRLYVVCTKGLEKHTDKTMSEVVIEVFGEMIRSRVGVLSGPSHAEEVSRQMPTTVTAAAYEPSTARRIQAVFFDPTFRVYTHDDVLGVEFGAAVKNVIAIAAGICDGLRKGDNAKAALLTRGLAEMMRLGRAIGVHEQTLSGLSGVGDLIVTAISRHSRNRNFGELLAQGLTVEQAAEAVGMVVEGIPTARAVHELARHHNVEMPISEAVYSILYEGKPVPQAAGDLLGREPKPEIY